MHIRLLMQLQVIDYLSKPNVPGWPIALNGYITNPNPIPLTRPASVATTTGAPDDDHEIVMAALRAKAEKDEAERREQEQAALRQAEEQQRVTAEQSRIAAEQRHAEQLERLHQEVLQHADEQRIRDEEERALEFQAQREAELADQATNSSEAEMVQEPRQSEEQDRLEKFRMELLLSPPERRPEDDEEDINAVHPSPYGRRVESPRVSMAESIDTGAVQEQQDALAAVLRRAKEEEERALREAEEERESRERDMAETRYREVQQREAQEYEEQQRQQQARAEAEHRIRALLKSRQEEPPIQAAESVAHQRSDSSTAELQEQWNNKQLGIKNQNIAVAERALRQAVVTRDQACVCTLAAASSDSFNRLPMRSRMRKIPSPPRARSRTQLMAIRDKRSKSRPSAKSPPVFSSLKGKRGPRKRKSQRFKPRAPTPRRQQSRIRTSRHTCIRELRASELKVCCRHVAQPLIDA